MLHSNNIILNIENILSLIFLVTVQPVNLKNTTEQKLKMLFKKFEVFEKRDKINPVIKNVNYFSRRINNIFYCISCVFHSIFGITIFQNISFL